MLVNYAESSQVGLPFENVDQGPELGYPFVSQNSTQNDPFFPILP